MLVRDLVLNTRHSIHEGDSCRNVEELVWCCPQFGGSAVQVPHRLQRPDCDRGHHEEGEGGNQERVREDDRELPHERGEHLGGW